MKKIEVVHPNGMVRDGSATVIEGKEIKFHVDEGARLLVDWINADAERGHAIFAAGTWAYVRNVA